LPDSAVKESQQRIDAALRFIDLKLPGKKIVINMAPADIRKEGSAYDLPIAIGILAASEQMLAPELSKYMMMGELSLDGGLQPVKGVLSIAVRAREKGFIFVLLNLNNYPYICKY
jgi:magnesium chelatase family protein